MKCEGKNTVKITSTLEGITISNNVDSINIKMIKKKADEINDFGTIILSERLITEIVKRDDEKTKQAIKDYFKQKYPKENLKFNFLDEEIIDEIINLGVVEYQKRRCFK